MRVVAVPGMNCDLPGSKKSPTGSGSELTTPDETDDLA